MIKKEIAYLCIFFLCSEIFFAYTFSDYQVHYDDSDYEKKFKRQIQRFLKIRRENIQKKRKFKISDSILSLNLETIEKLSYLDYTISQTLKPYLMNFYKVIFESLADICNITDDDGIIHDFYSSFNMNKFF